MDGPPAAEFPDRERLALPSVILLEQSETRYGKMPAAKAAMRSGRAQTKQQFHVAERQAEPLSNVFGRMTLIGQAGGFQHRAVGAKQIDLFNPARRRQV